MRTNHGATLPSYTSPSTASPAWVHPPVPENNGGPEKVPVGLMAVRLFLQALRQQSVEYCHWKSNVRLVQSLFGETDLDLLVNRADSRRFRQILYDHNIKPILAAPGKRYPAVEDYLGFDAESGRSFHLHVHYQLVLGEQFVKNYHLPLEAKFLQSVRWELGVAVPSPELEIIVLTMRALLKYRDRDVVKDILKIRYPGIPAHIMQEIHYLLGKSSLEHIAQTLASIRHIVPADIVLEFLTTIVEQPRAGYRLCHLRRRLRQTLNQYQRQNRVQATWTYVRELWSRRGSLLRFSPSQQMTPVNGGVTIAIIGADGSGKSTLSKLLRTWLGWKLDVWGYYLGSKEPSRRSRVLYMIFRMLRRSHSELTRRLDDQRTLCKWLARGRDNLLRAYHLSIGHDRFARYQQGMKKAMAGSIVIFDRFPLESITADSAGKDFRLLDGPQISLTAIEELGPIARALAKAEETLYQKMRPPDYLFVLKVSPEVSLQRKPDHQRATIEAKVQAVSALLAMENLTTDGINIIPLDADLPLKSVLAQLKAHLWDLL